MTKQPKIPPTYRITLVCRKEGERLTTAEDVKTSSFQCPLCKETLLYLAGENRIGAHGQHIPGKDVKAPPPAHELRKVIEVKPSAPGTPKRGV